MKVQGLNNQSFQQASKTSSLGKSSQGKATSFESLLGEAQDRDSSIQQDHTGAEREQSRQDNQDSKLNQPASAPRNALASHTVKSRPERPERQTASDNLARINSAQSKSRLERISAARAEASAREEDSVQTENNSAQDSRSELNVAAGESAQGLPTGQGAPTLGTPGLSTDRAGTAPQLSSAANLNPMAQPAQPTITDDAANSLTRRVVWNDFLRKMNDLGVSAEDVLKAFGSLSEKDLAQPPEQSMDKIVAALGLNGPQAAQAKQYFNELITKTKSKSLGEEITASSKQLSVTLASQRDMQRKAQLKSIDNLSNSFFMNKTMKAQPPQLEQTLGPDGQPMPAQLTMPESASPGLEQLNAQNLQGQQFARNDLPNVIQQPKSVEINTLVNQMADQQQQIPAEDKKSIDQLIKSFSARTSKATPEMAMAQAASAPVSGMQSMHSAGSTDADSRALNELNAILSGSRRKDDEGTEGSDDQSSSPFTDTTTVSSDQRMAPGQPLRTDFESTLEAKSTQAPQPMAANEVVQQAHIMVRDGGGDMKVTLTPEGLGEVALRVSVTDGKVNVQMITESDEAKKMLERQIGDLKGSLTQNHLQVDSIKVDTATNLGKQLEQQYQDAQRQQTQAQWEQFRQDSGGGWRRSFFDTGVVNPYRSQGEAPRDTRAPSAQARARSAGGSRRLDLVA